MSVKFNPFLYQWLLPSSFIQYTWDSPFYILRGRSLVIISPNNIVFLSLNIDFGLANSGDPDEMPHYAEFHLGLHCLPKH